MRIPPATIGHPTSRAHAADEAGAPRHRQKVLVVDDSTLSASLLGELLGELYDVDIAHTGAQALAMAGRHPPDLVLLDVLLPDMNGFQVLQQLKADAQNLNTPVIFITGLDRPEDEARGLTAGASDFITKPFSPPIVLARVSVHMRLARLVSELASLANLDALTGIANRRQFDEVLDKELRRAHRSGQPMCVAIIDIDFFKQYNDRYGHAQGDEALRAVARALQDRLHRPGDLVARYGGEEFAVVLPEMPTTEALALTRQLCSAVAALAIAHEASSAAPHLTVSIGVAGTDEGLGLVDGADLLQAADERLYEAKRSGRNRALGPPATEGGRS